MDETSFAISLCGRDSERYILRCRLSSLSRSFFSSLFQLVTDMFSSLFIFAHNCVNKNIHFSRETNIRIENFLRFFFQDLNLVRLTIIFLSKSDFSLRYMCVCTYRYFQLYQRESLISLSSLPNFSGALFRFFPCSLVSSFVCTS